MFKKFLNNINNKYQTIKEENNQYKELLKTTTTFNNFYTLPLQTNKIISEHIIHEITESCPDINRTKANIIATTIPINETILNVFYAKEILTNKEFFIIPTNLNLWIINTIEYKILSLDNNQLSIIKNNIMSKTILFNNTLLEINGNNEKINKLIMLLTNKLERQNIITEKTKYLCGIIPTYQQINSINRGISIDAYNNIVFHSKENNYKYRINQITNYEILLDNQTYYSKLYQSKTTITSMNNSCYQISIRITIENNTTIIIPILEPNPLGTKYQIQDSTFQNNLNFSKKIINKLEEYFPN